MENFFRNSSRPNGRLSGNSSLTLVEYWRRDDLSGLSIIPAVPFAVVDDMDFAVGEVAGVRHEASQRHPVIPALTGGRHGLEGRFGHGPGRCPGRRNVTGSPGERGQRVLLEPLVGGDEPSPARLELPGKDGPV